MKFRVIRKGDGSYRAQEKGWFFWHTFQYHHTFCSIDIKFDSKEEALDYIKEVRMSRRPDVVVKEFDG